MDTHKNQVKTSVSLPAAYLEQKSDGTIPPPPPLPHLPIRRQPSELLWEIRGDSMKRRSGHNLGIYHGLRHVETVEKRAFRVGEVVGHPMHVVTTQDLVKSFHKKLLSHVGFSEPEPFFPVGKVVRSAPVHVPKMRAHYSGKFESIAKKHSPGKLKKSAATTPEDELPRIPTPPPLDGIPMPTKSKQPMLRKPSPLDDISLPIRHQPSELLQEIRGDSMKRRSGHNLGAYHGLSHVETVEKRAFRVGKVVGHPMHMITTQDLVKSFNKKLLNHVSFSEPEPFYSVGKVVKAPPVHVPKMKAHFSPTKKSGFIAKKRSPGKLKKSVATAPEDELPRIPTPPPLDGIPIPTKSKQPMSKKLPPFEDIPMPKQAMSKKTGFVKRKKQI